MNQVNFPGASSTVQTPSGPGDVPLWGFHPLAPAIACLLVAKTAGELASDSVSLKPPRNRRERGGGFVDWLGNELKTGPFPSNHVREDGKTGRMAKGSEIREA